VRRFVLASASPRRKALLEALGLRVEVMPSGADEVDEGARPDAIVTANARLKRDEVARRLNAPATVIAADTLVFLDGAVLSKPGTLEEARAMLRRLAGRTHHVVTGLAIADTAAGTAVEGHETTAVTFRELTGDEVSHFVHAVKPLDRAGAYTADGPGSLLIARFDGCYQNVLGLPVPRLDLLLRELGVSLFEEMDAERSVFL
jgi:septum formation protein